MIGVTVMVKGTTTGVVTDIDGNFTIEDVPQMRLNYMFPILVMKPKMCRFHLLLCKSR